MSEKLSIEKPSMKKLLFHFRNFPITLTAIWLFTIILVINLNANENMWGNILLFLFLCGMGSFPLEAYYLKKHRRKCFFIILGVDLLVSLLLVHLPDILFQHLNVFKDLATLSNWNSYFIRGCVCYALILFLLGIYLCKKNCENTLGEYLIQVLSKTIHYHIVYFILMIGITLLCLILEELFALDYEFFLSAEFLLFGIYFMSAFLLSFYPGADEEGRLTAVLSKYVLSSMLLLCFVILYVYILKIFILWDIPSNALFRITAVLFFFMLPICVMNRTYEENNFLFPVMKWLPLIFIPFLFLQAYSIGIRLAENGVTPMRYAAVAFLVFECISLIVYFVKYEKLSLLLPTAAILIFLCGFTPFINMNRVSFYSQKALLTYYLEQPKELQETIISVDVENDDTFSRIRGAYSYLRQDHLGEMYLNQLPSEDKSALERLANADYSDDCYPSSINYYGRMDAACIPVSGYTSCYPIDLHEYYRDEEETPASYKAFLSSYPLLGDASPLFTVDLCKLFSYYQENADEDEDIKYYFTQHPTYRIDETHTLYMTVLSFTYDEYDDVYSSFRLEGYVLEK